MRGTTLALARRAAVNAAVLIAFAVPASAQDTTWFGGTVWNGGEARWEAVVDSLWTFDTGVGSALVPAGGSGAKSAGLHALLEGWSGVNLNDTSGDALFRRLVTADFAGEGQTCAGSAGGLGGDASLWAGLTGAEADARCWPGGMGYGDNWDVVRGKVFSYPGSGDVTLAYDYVVDTEPGFDFVYVEIDPDDTGPLAPIAVATYSGVAAASESLLLTQGGGTLPPAAGSFSVRFRVVSDGAYSDEDGFHLSACGAFAVDDVVLGGAVTDASDFESGTDGWDLISPPAPGGDYSDLRFLGDIPGPPTGCGLADTVLVFFNPATQQIESDAVNLVVSPWIDLQAAGVHGLSGRILELDIHQNFVRPERVGYEVFMQHKTLCATSGQEVVSPLLDPFGCFFGPDPCSSYDGCTDPGTPLRISWLAASTQIPQDAEQVRIAVGVTNVCSSWSDCPGANNDTTPYFDNIRFAVYDTTAATTGIPDLDTLPQLRVLSPNPLTGSAMLWVELAHPSTLVRLDVFDVRGRLVRHLYEGVGVDHIRIGWDRRNRRGAPVPAGIYYLTAASPQGRSVQRVLLLP